MASSGDGWQRLERPGSSIKDEVQDEHQADVREQIQHAHDAHAAEETHDVLKGERPWWRFWRRGA